MRLVDGEWHPITQGRHQYVVNITAGTVTFSISNDDGTTEQVMTNGVISADEDGILLTGDAWIKVAISATAVVDINHIGVG